MPMPDLIQAMEIGLLAHNCEKFEIEGVDDKEELCHVFVTPDKTAIVFHHSDSEYSTSGPQIRVFYPRSEAIGNQKVMDELINHVDLFWGNERPSEDGKVKSWLDCPQHKALALHLAEIDPDSEHAKFTRDAFNLTVRDTADGQ